MSFRSQTSSTSSMRPVTSYSSRSITLHRSVPLGSSASVVGGAGGHGARISSGGFGLASGYSSGSSFSMSVKGSGLISNEKETMQILNDRLASYLETVRNLEQANSKLELKIRETLEKRGPATQDYSAYEKLAEDLKSQIYDMTVNNARLVLQIDNARLAADDFRVKYESELAIRQSVESDIIGLRKVIDDTNIGRMNLETDIESLKEELIFIKKSHQTDVEELRRQISECGVQVDVDAPKGQDLSRIMEEIRAQYETIIQKNREELKDWHHSQILIVETEVKENTEALQKYRTEVTELRRQFQTLEIDIESLRTLKASLEANLHDVELRNNMEMEGFNVVIRQQESDLLQLRNSIQAQVHEYQALLNIKMKLEAEIATYRRLLDGEDFRLQDAMAVQTTKVQKKITVTETVVDGKVVSQSSEVQEIKK
ncbi:LOW QUALITY PROTEIN: keratin, type I cytoskeletal 18-A [Erpetoichthys calabaricus]|uniref:LOW QUALITY PROTEIN: keratin, type I cytoskeletal 18-A n=1 Tax=Erpetoichthys calabaricus TaxID=27687 RepID=UPI00223422F1|nr:LOW QUALITY PROTEIN: keratin, type I cytoskeletal 18-A [Erpetoichthys calabaricus]